MAFREKVPFGYLTIQEYAKREGISVDTVRRMIKTNLIDFVRGNLRIFIPAKCEKK